MKFTNRQLIQLQRGLRALDGLAKSKDEFLHYDYEKGIRWRIATTLKSVNDVVELFEDEKEREQQIRNLVAGEKITENNRNAAFELAGKINDLERQVVEISDDRISTFTLDELTQRPPSKDPSLPKANPIPPSVITALMPLIRTD